LAIVKRVFCHNRIPWKIRAREPLFPGIIGYDDTVVPQLVNAILSRHNFILLGLRGQAKSRILRSLVDLLDEAIAVVPGCEIHDDKLAPTCASRRPNGWRWRSPPSSARSTPATPCTWSSFTIPPRRST
jgi:Mg-chelatase subunit ChlI